MDTVELHFSLADVTFRWRDAVAFEGEGMRDGISFLYLKISLK